MAGDIVSGDRVVSQQEVLVRALKAATGFRELGMGEDSAVAIMLRNDFPFFEASFAGLSMGAYATPVNWHYKGEEIAHIVNDCGAKVLVIHSDLVPQMEGAVADHVKILVVPTPPEIQKAYNIPDSACVVPVGMDNWYEWCEQFAPSQVPPPSQRGSMIYTSGTTGKPKGVKRDPADEARSERMNALLAEVFGLTEKSRIVMTGPMYHSAPSAYGLGALKLGVERIVLQPRFEAEELLQLVERHKLTAMHMVPTMFVRLLKLEEAARNKYDISSIQFAVHAAAPCPLEIKRSMINWWGPVIYEYYGATETGAVVFCNSDEYLAHPGTVGKTMKDSEVKILDDNGKELPQGEIGEVFMKNDIYTDFTYHGQDEKRRAVETDGLITTGDIGYFDPGGYLFLCDRKVDMVISGGVNIYPAEIEAVLVEHPKIKDCAVFGIPDEEFGESLAAVVELVENNGLTAGEIKDYVKTRLSGYKSPKVVEFQTDLPREDSGKIFKRKLRQPYWEKAGRSI